MSPVPAGASSAVSQPLPALLCSAGQGVALVLGSEGRGLSQESRQHAQSVAIPMPGRAESLNVSQAGAILMFLLSQGLWPLAARLHGDRGLSELAAFTERHTTAARA